MPPFRLYNSITRAKDPFVAADPLRLTFYSCGPTVYDDAHVGNFRAFLFADLLRRWLESPLCTINDPDGNPHNGPRAVTHVMNITDVGHMTDDSDADGGGEDKMAQAGQRILEAKKSGRLPPDANIDPADPFAIARFFADRFTEDARTLGLKVAIESAKDPSLMPRATDAVEGMVSAIKALEEKAFAYQVGESPNRAVYFDVTAYEASGRTYGELSGNTVEQLRSGAGGRVSAETIAGKRSPADFLLWKEDDKHLMKWPSPWGTGYPGWHIECTAMSFNRLIPGGLSRVLKSAGDFTLDLHSGGEDNKFPHHECEIAQSRALTGSDQFARQWVHAAFLTLEGDKISKSKGNFVTPRELLDPKSPNPNFPGPHEPAAVRLELIKSHYRTNADFSTQGLKDTARIIERWRRFLEAADASTEQGEPDTVATDAFAARMSDDLDIAGAIGEINKWIKSRTTDGNTPSRADAETMRTFDKVLGVLELKKPEATATGIAIYAAGVSPDDRIESLLEERAAARKAKDFAKADAIRDQLAEMSLAIKDAPGGKVEVSKA